MVRYAMVLFCQFLCFSALTQTLHGRVLNADSSGPIAGASLFISNTSVGTIAGSQGDFVLANLPPGRFDLVVSAVGFETYIASLQASGLSASLVVYLHPKANELEDVVVRSYEKDGWKKWGTLFTETLIGTSYYASQCELKNKEAVKFVFNKKRNLLMAFANEALILENRGLGYELTYQLVEFKYDFKERQFLYKGYPLFKEMQPQKYRQANRWQQNRKDAYYGSLMHFMRSVFRNKIMEQGFDIKPLIKITGTEMQRVKPLYDLLKKRMAAGDSLPTGFTNDSLTYYQYVIDNPGSEEIVFDKILPGDSIAFAVDSVTAGILFDHYLSVTYTKKKEPLEYIGVKNGWKAGFMNSRLFLETKEPVVILPNGSFFDGKNLITSGYWAWSEKLGNRLPLDFWPR